MRFWTCFRFALVLLVVPAFTVGFWYVVFTQPEILIGVRDHPQTASRFHLAYLFTFAAIWTAAWLREAIRVVQLLRSPPRGVPDDGGQRQA